MEDTLLVADVLGELDAELSAEMAGSGSMEEKFRSLRYQGGSGSDTQDADDEDGEL